MSLKGKAQEVLKIIKDGGFHNIAGAWVNIEEEITYSVENTVLYRPNSFGDLTKKNDTSSKTKTTVIDVTDETTQVAAQRLVNEGYDNLVLLSFASARNPGGGFINGAKAQEEDLARCSTIYPCLLSKPEYYEINRSQKSMLYTDHMIYSPKVPWFRVKSRDKPNNVFLASVITAPAPNANQALRHGEKQASIQLALHRRCGQVLDVARQNKHRNIVLGAWGCGVFGNDPAMVAGAFKDWLTTPLFEAAFDKVVFAVYDRSKDQAVYTAFCTEKPSL